ncbi:MAG TPA: hypothetical protein VJN93_15175 [Candidatus Acidoferrum sp.]|nr:hypothetical protein [Candidatus Acidoferrum sp.]
MAGNQTQKKDAAAELVASLLEALQRERIVPRFVDSYVIEHGRQALQVHASFYRDLLQLLQREALLAATALVLDIASFEDTADSRGKPRRKLNSELAAFRRKYLAALARQQKWSVGESLDFQSDLQMYEQLIARAAELRRPRKGFEAANHPFVDRCAFILDSSFLEKARVAASRALNELEKLAESIASPSPRAASRIR